MTFESMQLKVCEACGNLWFRSVAMAEVYCSPCVQKLTHFPRAGIERRPGRKRAWIAAMQGDVQ